MLNSMWVCFVGRVNIFLLLKYDPSITQSQNIALFFTAILPHGKLADSCAVTCSYDQMNQKCYVCIINEAVAFHYKSTMTCVNYSQAQLLRNASKCQKAFWNAWGNVYLSISFKLRYAWILSALCVSTISWSLNNHLLSDFVKIRYGEVLSLVTFWSLLCH